MDEKTAVKRLQQGDISALEVLVNLYYLRAVRTAFLITRNRPLAEDVVQSAFIRIYERMGQYDPVRPFEPWFTRVVVNDALKALSRGPGSKETSLELEQEESFQPSGEDIWSNPPSWLETAETRREIWQALEELSPHQRTSLVLFYYLEMSEAQAAAQLGCTVGTFKAHLHTARKRLRQVLLQKRFSPSKNQAAHQVKSSFVYASPVEKALPENKSSVELEAPGKRAKGKTKGTEREREK